MSDKEFLQKRRQELSEELSKYQEQLKEIESARQALAAKILETQGRILEIDELIKQQLQDVGSSEEKK